MSDATQTPPTPPAAKPKRARLRPGDGEVAAPAADVRLLTLGQAAYLLNVSVSTVRRAVEEGQIRKAPVLGCVRITREAIDDFIRGAEHAKAPTSEAAAIQAAEEKVKREQRLRTRVVADWNTGADPIDLDAYLARQEARKARRKAKPTA